MKPRMQAGAAAWLNQLPVHRFADGRLGQRAGRGPDGDRRDGPDWLLSGPAEGAGSLLAAMAGSMITAAGVACSPTTSSGADQEALGQPEDRSAVVARREEFVGWLGEPGGPRAALFDRTMVPNSL